MKKIKFMLLALLAVVGIGGALAAIGTADGQNIIEYGNYVYKVTKMPTTNTPGEVTMMAIVEGKENAIVDADGNLDFPGHFTYTEGSKEHNFNVTKMDSKVYEDANYSVKHAVIPKELTEIPTGAFNTLTNLYDLTFEAGSQVTKIGAQAFASTQITTFDFSPCVKLEGLMDGVFVQKKAAGQTTENVNANITTITLPTSTAFKHINGAFRNLKALTTINNLENSWIRELVDEAFSGCEALKTLNLPGNDLLYISKNALKGSAIEELKVNVGTGVTNGNPMKLLGGCTVAYRFDEINRQYIYNYEDADGTKIAAYNTAVATYNAEHPTATLEAVPTWAANNDAWTVAEATTNLYGLSEPTTAAPTVAPLKKLTIEGTLKGKICTNAFAWCKKIDDETITGTPTPDFVVSEMEFGSKGQIQSHAFFDCTGIDELTLGDLGDNKLGENEGFTIDHNAFEGCPIATLTLGDILTANAIGSAAFGTSLKNVTIGSVKASAKAAFYGGSEEDTYATLTANLPANTRFLNADKKLGAFVWTDDNNEGATLKLAVGGSLSNDTPETGYVIPAKTFDMSNIDVAPDPKLNPAIEIGEIASEGGVFAEGAIVGVAIEKITFKGDIAANGLQNAILENKVIKTPVLTYEQEKDLFDKTVETPKSPDATDLAAGDEVISGTEGKVWKVKSVEGSDVTYYTHDKLYTAEEKGDAVAKKPTDLTIEAGDFVEAGTNFKKVESRATQDNESYNHNLKYLVFEGMIKTSGIGGTAFQNFNNLKKITFGGLLSKEAVMAGAFKDAGKVNEGLTGADKKYNGCIGTKENPFVVYTADLTDNDASENPFATGAFNTERCTRIIYWSISDEKLSASILAAIQKDVLDNDGDAETVYDGEVVNPKFNVYKWVAYLDEDVVAKGLIVYPDNRAIDLDRNIDKKFAWGRYDLGSFTLEKGPNAQYVGNDYIQGTGYDAMDMIITRFQKDQTDQAGDYINLAARGVTTGNKYNVKVTLYGVYWDEDDFAQQSSVYMVPLEVINGQYQIRNTNTHTIIVKVENLDGEFAQADNQVLINYDGRVINNQAGNQPAGDGSGDDILTGNSVWEQLQAETAGNGPVKDAQGNAIKRIFQKANFSWTNQELVDAVKNASGTAQNIVNKDLYAMLNPAANAGFDIKRFVIERKTDGTGAYIGLNWYYTLLNSYPSQANGARIIWLDDAEATAIFGVKGVDVKESLRAKDNAIYNLQGVRVSKPGKGLYIQNGKKFIVK